MHGTGTSLAMVAEELEDGVRHGTDPRLERAASGMRSAMKVAMRRSRSEDGRAGSSTIGESASRQPTT
jgi:hypothetical protein